VDTLHKATLGKCNWSSGESKRLIVKAKVRYKALNVTLYNLVEKGLQYIFFGGKGGVGKTTCAAATAVHFADLGKKTVIISTDPAHSISDSFEQDLSGGEVTPVSGVPNLFGLEINPQKAQQAYQEATAGQQLEENPLANNPLADIVQGADAFSMPGVDEGLAFTKVMEYMNSGEYDVVILDTAPTGHTLRLLSLPEIMDSFIGRFISIQVKLKNMLGMFGRLLGKKKDQDRTMEVLEHQKKVIEDARSILNDPKLTTFVPVMIPELMAINETERLLSTLLEYEIPNDHIIVNMIIPPGEHCKFCASRQKMQESNLKEITEIYDEEYDLTLVPLFTSEIHGIELLRKLGTKTLFKKTK
jgi:arsenite-transporting ATPase